MSILVSFLKLMSLKIMMIRNWRFLQKKSGQIIQACLKAKTKF